MHHTTAPTALRVLLAVIPALALGSVLAALHRPAAAQDLPGLPTAPGENELCPDRTGWDLRACLRAGFKPTNALDYDAQRDALFADVWLNHRGGPPGEYLLRSVYSDAGVSLNTAHPTLSPREQAQNRSFNTEHAYPQSKGARRDNARADLHHLLPTYSRHNTARSNFPYAEVDDANTVLWINNITQHPRSDFASWGGAPPHSIDDYSEVWRTPNAPPYDAGLFEPREAMKGDVARAVLYFYTMYQVEADNADPYFFETMRQTLLDWHAADPADAWERTRSLRAAAYQQDKANPYVFEASLAERAFGGGVFGPPVGEAWINEFHVSNEGPDTAEGVEIAGPAGTDLYGWRLWFYGGWGEPYNPPDSTVAEALTLDGAVDDEGPGYGAVWFPVEGLYNRCHGLALFDPDGRLVHFLSYGGCTFNALEGPVWDWAIGQRNPALAWSAHVGDPARGGQPQESHSTPEGLSVQLAGAGTSYADFAWAGPLPASPGRLNDHQGPPASRPGPSAPHSPPYEAVSPAGEGGVPRSGEGVLTVSAPFPNPTRAGDAVALTVTAPPDAHLRLTLFDALGREAAPRAVPEHAGGTRTLPLPTATLAPGLYLLRVTAVTADGRALVEHRRLTLLR